MRNHDDGMLTCRIFLLAWIPYVLTCVIAPQFLLAMVFAIEVVLGKQVGSHIYATKGYIRAILFLIGAIVIVTAIPEQYLSGWTKSLIQVVFFAFYQFSMFLDFYKDREKVIHDTRVDRIVLKIVVQGLAMKIRGGDSRFILQPVKRSTFR